MAASDFTGLLQQAIFKPEPLWQEEAAKTTDLASFIKGTVLPVVTVTAVLSGVLLQVFGYRLPMIGVVRPSLSDTVIQIVGSIVMYLVSLVILGWIAAFLAGKFGGDEDLSKGVSMLFWISVPTFAGQILGTLPYIGWVISLGLGIYSLILLYRAIPVFLGIRIEERVKHFVLFLIAAFVVSMVLGMTLGRLFTPSDMMHRIQPDVAMPVNQPVNQNVTR